MLLAQGVAKEVGRRKHGMLAEDHIIPTHALQARVTLSAKSSVQPKVLMAALHNAQSGAGCAG